MFDGGGSGMDLGQTSRDKAQFKKMLSDKFFAFRSREKSNLSENLENSLNVMNVGVGKAETQNGGVSSFRELGAAGGSNFFKKKRRMKEEMVLVGSGRSMGSGGGLENGARFVSPLPNGFEKLKMGQSGPMIKNPVHSSLKKPKM